MVFFFFEKKKQKALFCFAEGLLTQTLGEADAGASVSLPQSVPFWFFSGKNNALV
jgi:hypothetical protein